MTRKLPVPDTSTLSTMLLVNAAGMGVLLFTTDMVDQWWFGLFALLWMPGTIILTALLVHPPFYAWLAGDDDDD